MKITFLLVERSFVPALRQAAAAIPDLDLAIHVLPDVHGDEGWQAAGRDVADSLAVFAIHITDEGMASRLERALAQHGQAIQAFVPLNCIGSVMRRARLGRLDLAGQRGFMSRFGSLIRRPSKPRSEESYAAVMRRASSWLRFAPGRAQDFRTYLLLYSYYLNASPDNLRNLLRLVLQRYGGWQGSVEPPVEYPATSLYHPDAPRLFEHLADYLAWHGQRSAAPDGPHVGLILFRSFVLNGNTAHYDAVIRALEQRGLVPLPALASAMDNRQLQARYFSQAQAIVSLTGFGYVGGMGANDAPAAIEALKEQGVPYLDTLALTFQTVEDWQASPIGLNPLQSAMQVAIPELDGAIEPLIYGGIPAGSERFQPLPERVDRLAGRLRRIVDLRTKANADKRVAVTLFSFPPNRGNLGTAAYLDVFASLHRLLQRLQAEGYTVEGVPATPDELRRLIADGNASQLGMPANVAARVPLADYRRGWPWLAEVEACWGPAPGALNADGADLLVLGRHFGNVFVGVQPSFGYEGDPLRLLAASGQTPHHGFCAFYVYLRDIWRADAVVHFGTHGSLEFMPGKQVGLSEACWPDRLIGDLPNVYLYSVGNPSEGTIAKRRSYATLVSYLTPPMSQAGLYAELLQLKDLIDVYRRTHDAELLSDIRRLAQATALESDGVAVELQSEPV